MMTGCSVNPRVSQRSAVIKLRKSLVINLTMLVSQRISTTMQIKFALIFLSAVIHLSTCKDLPQNFNKCKLKDPNIGECLKNNVNDALKKLKDGLPKFGILPIDPMAVNAITISQGEGAPINLKQSYTDIKLHGLSETVLTVYKPELDRYYIYCEAINPAVVFEGTYKMEGRVLLLPVTGTGKSNITMFDLKTTNELIGESFVKNNKTYMKVLEYKVKFTPKKVEYKFENLFNGDKALGDNMNKFLNENWEVVFNELKSGYEDTFGYIFKDIANKIFTKVPFNKIFE